MYLVWYDVYDWCIYVGVGIDVNDFYGIVLYGDIIFVVVCVMY